MQVRVITLRYSEECHGFPEEALKKAIFGREVLSVSEHFFIHGNVPHLTLVLSLGDNPFSENSQSYVLKNEKTQNPEDDLNESQKVIYRALKTWRNETAKEEGRPSYVIARNQQLASLVKNTPKTLAEIKEIEGFGDSFCERYGKTVLSFFNIVEKHEVQEEIF